MKQELKKLLNNAYAPYSNVRVAAILIDKNNNYYRGVNVENASYGGTICAERNAMWRAIADGKKPKEFQEIHVYSNLKKFLYPCSICRQIMVELFDLKTKIIIHDDEKEVATTIEKLVPHIVNKLNF